MESAKRAYEAPTINVVEMKTEGIVCASGEGRDPWDED